MKSLFSVVTLTYKNFNHLKETVLSVCGQDYENIEYIISDDGSDNFPREQIVEWIEKNKGTNLKNYKVLRQAENVGTVRNINYAYHQATGDYFINLSCGDVFFERKSLSKVAERITQSNAQMLITSRMLYSDTFKPIGILPHFEDHTFFHSLQTKEKQYKSHIMTRMYSMASGSVMCTSRKAMEKLNYYDEAYKLLEDGPIIAKFLQEFKLECCPEIVSIWYEQGGISTGGMKKTYPLLRKDTILFNETERVAHMEMFTPFEKRKIRYGNDRIKAESKKQRFLCYLKYPIQTLMLIKTKIAEENKCKNDEEYIARVMANRGPVAVEGC